MNSDQLQLSTLTENYQPNDSFDWCYLDELSVLEDSSRSLFLSSSIDNILEHDDPTMSFPSIDHTYYVNDFDNLVEHDHHHHPLISFPHEDHPHSIPYYDHDPLINNCITTTNVVDFPEYYDHDPLINNCITTTNVVGFPEYRPHSQLPQTFPNPIPDFLNDFETWWNSNLSLLGFANQPTLEFDYTQQVNVTVNDVTPTGSATATSVMDDHEESAAFVSDDGRKRQLVVTRRSRSKPKSKPKSSGLELEEVQKYFHLPIVKAAKELKVGVTVLKKRCRELNIARWPHRKIKSLKCLIDNVKELGMTDENEIENLEDQKKELEKEPQLTLTARTKKLRQACFKANYKRRRLLHTSSSSSMASSN